VGRWLKLGLDILIGAVIPIYLLENMSERWGTVPTYVVAALIPVAYVLVDTLFITRRFNVITSFAAAGALLRGGLAFWFVDGLRFAVKDTLGFVLNLTLFGGSLLLGKPIMRFFLAQALAPDNAEKRAALDAALAEGGVARAIRNATGLLAGEAALTGVVNFALNLQIVTAAFGDAIFNKQVAQVNAITRIAFTVTSFLAFGLGFFLIYRTLYAILPEEPGKAKEESDLLTLIVAWYRARRGEPSPGMDQAERTA